MDYGFLSILPPLVAILLALITREVYLSLFGGVLIGEMIISGYDIFSSIDSSLNRIIFMFSEPWFVKTLIFAILVGSIIVLILASGGVAGFVEYVTTKYKKINTKRGSLLFAFGLGAMMFVESSITALISGTVAKPITDKCKVSREKLAFVCDSVSAPICSLIPLNAWGALLLGLIGAQVAAGVLNENPIDVLLNALLFNFYSMSAIVLLLVVIISGKDFGPMKKAEERAEKEGKLIRDGAVPVVDEDMINIKAELVKKPDILNMILPLGVLVAMVPIGLYITGKGDFLKGSGSTAVFWAVLTSIAFSGFFYISRGVMKINEFIKYVNKGAGAMMPVAMILVLAFAIGSLTVDMKAGEYLASLLKDVMNPQMAAALIFVLASIISFSTGTSWGTFSIMMPIAIQLSVAIDSNIYLAVAAVISGGVFGDHCSIISDTTIVSSMAAGSDHVDHANTQLPYGLLSAFISFVLFVIFGFVL
ncbi:MAG: hypothetical protein QG567_684 [Campylobacterota bacterium]|nr:hypothetical protein [Campylobacterota bacterium]